jgi:hypothetical protein
MAHGLTQHTLFFSDARLELECDCEAVNDAIAADWGSARRPMLDTMKSHHLGVYATDTLTVTFDDEIVWSEPLDQTPTDPFEWVLYRKMFAEHHDRFGVLHGAAVVSNQIAWLLCGPSGAGKSSLSVAALRRGYDYYSDEFVVTDGSAIWGWPRTPHFGPPQRDTDRLPSWFADMGAPDEHGTHRRPVPHEQVAKAPTPADRVHLVFIEQGSTTALTPLEPMAALQCLSEAAFFESSVPFGKLVARGRTWRGVWRHPDEILDALESATLHSLPAHCRDT